MIIASTSAQGDDIYMRYFPMIMCAVRVLS